MRLINTKRINISNYLKVQPEAIPYVLEAHIIQVLPLMYNKTAVYRLFSNFNNFA